jgi:hypothetical protein
MIKKALGVFAALILGYAAGAQENWPPLDNSPMDMIYLPVDYPVLKIRKSAPEMPVIKIIYSRPQKKHRKIFGELVEYGSVWRLGANEATELDLFKDVKIANTKIKKGRYTLYAIPYENKWTIIINKENDVWGAFAYDMKKDILRTDVKTEKTKEQVESFTMKFEETGTGANLLIAWEDVKVSLPVTL